MVEAQQPAKVSPLATPSYSPFQLPKGTPKVKTEDLVIKYKRKEVEDLLKRKFFVIPSFEIYGGVAGFFDFGPLGSALKQAVEDKWRNHFVLEEDMLEVTTTNLVVHDVLKTSGHVDKFSDFMVRDVKTNQPRRADKLIQESLDKMIAKSKKPEEVAKL
jgi:glycyl-tRNA synthetase